MRKLLALLGLSLGAFVLGLESQEEPALISRPAMAMTGGQIGALYDARKETLTGFYLWPNEVTANHVLETSVRKSALEFAYSNSLEDRMQLLGVKGHVKILYKGSTSILIEGSAEYLSQYAQTKMATYVSLLYNMRTIYQSVDAFHPEMRAAIYTDILNKKLATHVVTGITWGANCIALFEKIFTSEFDRLDVAASLALNITTRSVEITAEVSGVSNSSNNYTFDSTNLRLYGDLLPPTDKELPVSAEEGIALMRRLHTIGLEGNGVPMQLILTPLKWLSNSADSVIFAVSESLVSRAMQIFQELEDSEATIKDLLKIPAIGFLAWKRSVSKYLDRFSAYNMEFAGNLLRNLKSLRINGDATPLAAMFQAYYDDEFSTQKVLTKTEEYGDMIQNLKAEVKSLMDVGVKMVEHYHEFSAPGLDRSFDKVYALILVGLQPDHNPDRVRTMGRFLNLAKARQRKGKHSGPPDHCLEVQGDNNDLVCLESMKFLVIHFNSFCENFCEAQYCEKANEVVKASPMPCTPSGNRDFPSNCWCANPNVTNVYFENSEAGLMYELPAVPPPPVIISVVGDRGTGNIESSPYNQQIKLTLRKPDNFGSILNYQVRVIWFVANKSASGTSMTWLRKQRTFETRGHDNTIVVSGLISGEQYRFQVASKTDVGTSAFCKEWPEDFVQVSTNTVLLYPRGKNTSLTEVPNWYPLPLKVEVSKELLDPIGKIVFYSNGLQVECEIDGARNEKFAECVLPPNTLAVNDLAARVLVYSESDDSSAQGFAARTIKDITLRAPGLDACKAWPGTTGSSLFCNLKTQADNVSCVSNCNQCSVVTNKTIVPNTVITTTEAEGKCSSSSASVPRWVELTAPNCLVNKGDETGMSDCQIVVSGILLKIRATHLGGAISQKEWTYQSQDGWKQRWCQSGVGWPLYAADCTSLVPAVFRLKAQTVADGEDFLVSQPSPTTFPAQCTIPSTPTSILECRLKRSWQLKGKGSDVIKPQGVGPSYTGQVSYKLEGWGYFDP